MEERTKEDLDKLSKEQLIEIILEQDIDIFNLSCQIGEGDWIGDEPL